MRKVVKYLILLIVSTVLLTGCSNNNKEENVESFIEKLVSYNTYESIGSLEDNDKFIEGCKLAFEGYLSDEAFNSLMSNRTFSIYSKVMSEAKGVTDINITKISETQNEGYIHLEYEVAYKLEFDDETIDMKDYMAFNILDKNLDKIEKVSISEKTSSIFKELKNHI